jgi:tetratricopeptide (TPR) repeat protein
MEGIHKDGIHLEEALRKYEEYADFGGEDAIAALLTAEAFAHQNQREDAFQQLEKAASYGMNIARAVQQFPSLKSYTSDTRFVRAALRLERYNLSVVAARDPFTGPWSQVRQTPGSPKVGPFDEAQQKEFLAEARTAMRLIEYALRNGDQVSAMDAYAKIEEVGSHLNRFDVPELSSELRSILERLDELEEGIDQIRVAYLYEQARSMMELMRVSFEEQQFDLVNQTHGEVVAIAQDISMMGDSYQAASSLVIQAADQFQQRSDIVREFLAKNVSVEGVVVAEDGSHAIINAELIAEGGQVLDGVLESVQRDRVVILYRGEKITHKFGRF